MPDSDDLVVERVTELLRVEFYETLEDAAGAGEAYDYEAFARRIVAVTRGEDDDA